MTSPHKILFVCRHNAVRSQIAEALTNKICRGKALAHSAGPEPQPVPVHITEWVNQLSGSNIKPVSKGLNEFDGEHFDTIITLCDKTHVALPEIKSDQQHIRWDFQHADEPEALRHLEIEISERLRLMLLAKGLL